jgi:hydroxymethylpyrimidine/phosphomethylpyrimidine kinase
VNEVESLYRGIALSIAGTDSGGGAGIQADLKTFAALRVFGMNVITAITAQNSLMVSDIENLSPRIITAQMDAVFSDFTVNAAKTGMLSREETIRCVCDGVRRHNVTKLVVDPVMIAQSGASLIDANAVEALREELLPLALLVTPNVPEAERLSGQTIANIDEMASAARIIAGFGPKAVLVKGGHMITGDVVTDILFANGTITRFDSPRVPTDNTHGTGCTLSAAIAAELAAGGDLPEAVRRGRQYLMLALRRSFRPGHGAGPLGHAVLAPWLV